MPGSSSSSSNSTSGDDDGDVGGGGGDGDDNNGVDGNGTTSWALTSYCFKPLTCINLSRQVRLSSHFRNEGNEAQRS